MKLFILLIFLLLTPFCFASNHNFERFVDRYNNEYELASSGISSYYIINGTIQQLSVRLSGKIFVGNATFVSFRYKHKHNTIIHTHINNNCNPSRIDINAINSSKYIKTSIILCNNSYTLLVKQDKEIIIIKMPNLLRFG